MNVELHIEELLLHGFASEDRYLIGEAVQHELARLLAEGGEALPLTQGNKFTRRDGGGFEVARDAKAETIGAQIALAIYGGVSR